MNNNSNNNSNKRKTNDSGDVNNSSSSLASTTTSTPSTSTSTSSTKRLRSGSNGFDNEISKRMTRSSSRDIIDSAVNSASVSRRGSSTSLNTLSRPASTTTANSDNNIDSSVLRIIAENDAVAPKSLIKQQKKAFARLSSANGVAAIDLTSDTSDDDCEVIDLIAIRQEDEKIAKNLWEEEKRRAGLVSQSDDKIIDLTLERVAQFKRDEQMAKQLAAAWGGASGPKPVTMGSSTTANSTTTMNRMASNGSLSNMATTFNAANNVPVPVNNNPMAQTFAPIPTPTFTLPKTTTTAVQNNAVRQNVYNPYNPMMPNFASTQNSIAPAVAPTANNTATSTNSMATVALPKSNANANAAQSTIAPSLLVNVPTAPATGVNAVITTNRPDIATQIRQQRLDALQNQRNQIIASIQRPGGQTTSALTAFRNQLYQIESESTRLRRELAALARPAPSIPTSEMWAPSFGPNRVGKTTTTTTTTVNQLTAAQFRENLRRQMQQVAAVSVRTFPGAPTATIPIDGNSNSISADSKDANDVSASDTEDYGMVRTRTVVNAKDLENIKEMLDTHNDVYVPIEQRMRTPPQMAVELLEHQKIGVMWMTRRETMEGKKGGLLADDMGLGKTIQTIATIVSNPPDRNSIVRQTLVVAPVSLLDQWISELEKKVKPGHRLKVYKYHGPNRIRDPEYLQQFDVIVTSYSMVGSDWPDEGLVKANTHQTYSVSEKNATEDAAYSVTEKAEKKLDINAIIARAGPLFKIKWFRIVLDEAHTIKNKLSKTAKACFRLNGDRRWALTGTPFENHVRELYSLIKFLDIEPYSIWANFNKDIAKPLTLNYARANNRAMERVQFLIKAICLRRNKGAILDGKPILPTLPSKTVHEIRVELNEDERAFYDGLREKNQRIFSGYLREGQVLKQYISILALLLRMRQAALHPWLLKKDFYDAEQDDGELNGGANNNNNNGDDDDDEDNDGARDIQFHEATLRRLLNTENLDGEECPICFDTPRAADASLTICGHVFCNGCIRDYIGYANRDDSRCPTCNGNISVNELMPLTRFIKKHKYVNPAANNEEDAIDLDKALTSSSSSSDKKSPGDSDPDPDARANVYDAEDEWISSSKVDKLLEILVQIQERSPGDKVLVFSQFTEFLSLLEVPLTQSGVKYVRFDGKMPTVQRTRSIETFRSKPDVNIMLVSLKCGSLGLNLTMAQHIVLMDFWWNPQIEAQAVDRVHRYGQTRPVTVYRIRAEDTVDERILALQDKKRQMFLNAMDENELDEDGNPIPRAQRRARLSIAELRALFDV